MVSKKNEKFILGQPFLTRYYTILDIEKHRIGFTLAADTKNIPANSHSVTIVLITVFSLILFALVVGLLIRWRKKKRAQTYAHGNTEVTATYQEVKQDDN